MLETLLTAIVVALSSVGLTVILRNAPIIRIWVREMKKPWACNICMPLYTGALVVGGLFCLHHDGSVFLSYLPAYALSFMTLEAIARPPSAPPQFMELEDNSDE